MVCRGKPLDGARGRGGQVLQQLRTRVDERQSFLSELRVSRVGGDGSRCYPRSRRPHPASRNTLGGGASQPRIDCHTAPRPVGSQTLASEMRSRTRRADRRCRVPVRLSGGGGGGEGTSPRNLRTNRTPTKHHNKEMSCPTRNRSRYRNLDPSLSPDPGWKRPDPSNWRRASRP